jgi:hypothetical protein
MLFRKLAVDRDKNPREFGVVLNQPWLQCLNLIDRTDPRIGEKKNRRAFDSLDRRQLRWIFVFGNAASFSSTGAAASLAASNTTDLSCSPKPFSMSSRTIPRRPELGVPMMK